MGNRFRSARLCRPGGTKVRNYRDGRNYVWPKLRRDEDKVALRRIGDTVRQAYYGIFSNRRENNRHRRIADKVAVRRALTELEEERAC